MRNQVAGRFTRRTSLMALAAIVGGTAAAACGEVEVRYVQGPPGPPGPAGPQGEKGAAGPRGAKGAAGAAGKAVIVEKKVEVPVPAKPAPKATVRIMFPPGWADWTMAQRLPVFEKEHPNIKPQFERNSEYHKKLAVMFAAGTPADLMIFEADDEAMYAFWAAKGVLNQLDSYIARDKFDMSVFFPQVLHSLKLVDGKIWAFPFFAFMARCGLFFNKNKFREKGVPLPTDNWTYDDMADAARKFTVRKGTEVEIMGGGRKFGGDLAIMATLRAFGGDLYNADGTKTLVATKESQAAITWWFDRRLKDRILSINLLDRKDKDPMRSLKAGRAAFVVGYNPGDRLSVAKAFNEAGVPWGLLLAPKGPAGRRGGAFFNSPLGSTKVSKVKDAAWELQKFFASKESGITMGTAPPGARNSSHFGPRFDVYADPRVLNAPGMPPGAMETVAKSMQLDEPFSYARNFRAAAVEKVANTEYLKALKQEVQYDSGFFQNVARAIQAILDMPRETG